MGLGMVGVELFLSPSLKALWEHPLWFWGSVFAGILWACGQSLANLALDEISLAKASVFFNVNSFINIGFGLVVFHEASGLKAYLLLLAGGILIFLGAWWVARVSATPAKEGNLKKGLILSLLAGVFWGFYFTPIKILQTWYPEVSLTFVDAFSGMILGGAGPALLLGLFHRRKDLTVRNASLGVLTATLWAVGTIFFLLAIQSLGLSRAVPIVNSSTLVYTCWSLFVFKEIPFSQGPKVLGGTLLVVGGVILMAFSK
ncbi:MAG TPA: GRP family sugar transporter, partial [bacterium]